MDLINKNLITLELNTSDKEDTILELAKLLEKENRINNLESYIECVNERENLIDTSMGSNIAIPHGKSDSVDIPSLAFAKTKDYIRWGEDKNSLVDKIFMIAVPTKYESNEYLKILAGISRKLANSEFREKLSNADDKESIYELIKSAF